MARLDGQQSTGVARQNLRDSGFNPRLVRNNGQLSVCVLAKISRLSVKPVNRTGENVNIFFPVATEAELQEHLLALSRFLQTDGGADAAVAYARERQIHSKVKWEKPVSRIVLERQEGTELDEKKRKRKGTKPGQPVRKFSVGAWTEQARWGLPLKESKETLEDIASVTGVCFEEALELAKTEGEHGGVKLSVAAGSVRRILSSGRETILAVPEELGNLGWAKIVRAATEGGVFAYSRWELNGAFLVAHRRDRQLLATYANYVEAADAEKIDAQLLSEALRGASGGAVFRDFYWEIEQSKRQRPTQRGTGTTGQRLYFCYEGVMVKGPCIRNSTTRAELGRQTMSTLKEGGPEAVQKLWEPHWQRGWLPPYGAFSEGNFFIDWKLPVEGEYVRFKSPRVASPSLLLKMSEKTCDIRDSIGSGLAAADARTVVQELDDALAPFVAEDSGSFLSVQGAIKKMVIITGCVPEQDKECLDFTELVFRKLMRASPLRSWRLLTRRCGSACKEYARHTRDSDGLVATKPSLCAAYTSADLATSKERVLRYLEGNWTCEELCDAEGSGRSPTPSPEDVSDAIFVFAGTKARACLSGREMSTLASVSYAFLPHPVKWQLAAYGAGVKEFLELVGIKDEEPRWFVHPFLSRLRRTEEDLMCDADLSFPDRRFAIFSGDLRGVSRLCTCAVCGTGPMATGSWHAHAACQKHKRLAAAATLAL